MVLMSPTMYKFPSVQRRKLKLEAKFESGSSYFSLKRGNQAVDPGRPALPFTPKHP